jgi:hypothetical protein
MTRLTATSLSAHRTSKAKQQGLKCPICGASLGGGHALDHCHTNGQCRSVLCRTCNTTEGKVLAGLSYKVPRNHLARRNKVLWLKRLVAYYEHWDNNPSGLFHPTFDTSTGKQKPVKRRRASAKPKGSR